MQGKILHLVLASLLNRNKLHCHYLCCSTNPKTRLIMYTAFKMALKPQFVFINEKSNTKDMHKLMCQTNWFTCICMYLMRLHSALTMHLMQNHFMHIFRV